MVGLRFSFGSQQDKEKSTQHKRKLTKSKSDCLNKDINQLCDFHPAVSCCMLHLVGTGTSVRAPSMTACCRRTNATKEFSKKSTSPTSTFDASASRGNFFMNLFFSCQHKAGGEQSKKRQDKVSKPSVRQHCNS